MATYSRILAREIPWTEEPGGLQPMESGRVGYNLATEQQQHLLFWRLTQQNHGSKNLGCTRNELVVTDHLCEQVWEVWSQRAESKKTMVNVAGSQQGQVSTSPPFKNIIVNTTGSQRAAKGKLKWQRERKREDVVWVPVHEMQSLGGFHLFSKMGGSLLKRRGRKWDWEFKETSSGERMNEKMFEQTQGST